MISNLSDKLGALGELGKSFRKISVAEGHRFISTTSLGFVNTVNLQDIVNAFNVDYELMHKRHDIIKNALDKGSEVRVTTPGGTDITINIKDRIAVSSQGTFFENGCGGNLPAGEVYIPPLENGSNGVVVIDGSSRSRNNTALTHDEPVKITVEDGKAVKIEGGTAADELRDSFEMGATKAKYPERIKVLCEFGISTNPNAKLMGTTIIDEKVLGYCHVAFGSNTWFGGKNSTIMHFDQVMKDPKIYIDGKLLDFM